MNRYPVWVYTLVAMALVIAALYAVPNLFGEAPAVQISSARATVKVDAALQAKVEETLKTAGIATTGMFLDLSSIKVRLADTETQGKAKDAIERALVPDADNPSYTVAFNLLSNSPNWLTAIRALPMYQIGRAHV